ncbi:kinase-like domain-containing protein, partial [Gigaspora rosea]
GITVALKHFNRNNRNNEYKHFVKELKSLKKLDHPNIIHFYGITKGYNSDRYCLVLEYANNRNLRNYLQTNKLDWKEKKRIATEISLGLLYLHKNEIIHRDFHSKNILICDKRVKIADFGLSKAIESTELIKSELIAMISYVEPQCLMQDFYKHDKRSDIYSLGVIFWEISSGKPPFEHHSHYGVLKKILKELSVPNTPVLYKELYTKCWDYDPKKQPEIRSVCNEL